MRKIFSAILLLIVIFLFFFKQVKAQSDFKVDASLEYKILENGAANVTNTITIENLKSDYFPKQYVLNLKGIFAENIKAYETGSLLDTELKTENGNSSIIVKFSNNSVGKGTSKTFVISYIENTISRKNGEIWEVVLPRVADPENYNSYRVSLSVPQEFGQEAFISPQPSTTTKIDKRVIYKFEDYHDLPSGVTAGFGVFQVYSFSLNYHLDNLQNGKRFVEIALPPDTSTQKMFYESINPLPADVKRDVDGNWIAEFKENKNQTVVVKGYVQVFSNPNNLNHTLFSPSSYDLLPTSYWQSDEYKIKEIANELETVEDVYKYVVNKLNYNYKRALDNNERYGALKALENPEDALCMEFTDLFIALARAKGIPAREVNGYAYSQNPLLEPLSLSKDVLHAWAEYWDQDKKLWIPVDPTWEKTTEGVDFFNKFDLRHFAFVIHSRNSVLPYAAGNYKSSSDPTKDVSVSFGVLPERKALDLRVQTHYKALFPFFVDNLEIVTENHGQNALYNFPVITEIAGNKTNEQVEVFLPFSKKTFDYKIKYGLFAILSPDYITLNIGDSLQNVPVNRTRIIIAHLALITALLLVLFVSINYRNLKKMLQYIRKK